MNRIFKFRAWEKSNNKMYECIVGNTDTKDDKFICPLIWIEENSCWVHSDTCIIMQYTGYKDRNLKNDEVVFEDKAKAEYLKEYYQQNDCVAYAKIIAS